MIDDNNFFATDRLVEFGMSIVVAQQMVKTMNEAMANMQVPGAMAPSQKTTYQSYYVMIGDKQARPFSEQELTRLIAEKKVFKESYVWRPGLTRWEMAETLPDVLKLVALTPPQFHKNNS